MTAPAWRRPGFLIGIASLIALITFGARSGFGLFLEPMSSTFGWGREVFALAIAVQNIMWGVGQPIAGAIADRYGVVRVLIVGSLIYAAGLVLMSMSTTPAMLTISAGFFIGVGGAGASFGLVMAAVGRLLPDERRSWAFGVIVAANSLGQFLMVPLGQAFIFAYGWSTALVLIGGLVLFVIPLSLSFKSTDESTASATTQTLSQALREATGHKSYLLLVAGFFVCGYHVAFIQTHLPAYVADEGISPAIGAWAIALVGLFNIVGSFGSGVLGGRFSKKYLLSLIYFFRAVVIGVYVLLPLTATSTLIFAGAMGLLWLSTVPLTSGLVAVMFGPRYLATLFGIVFLGHQVGAFLGVWMGGYIFDTVGNYNMVWWISVVLGLIAAIVHWPITERPVARMVTSG
ncbi:MAG: MFS transporter [Pseudomonadota bacterium]